MALSRAGVMALLISRAALGQPAGAPRSIATVVAGTGAPTITILSAATGALVRSLGAGNAFLDLGRVSYFKGPSTAGETSQKTSGSFVITTRFALKVDCPGNSLISQVDVTMALMDAAASHTIAIDGAPLGSAPRTLAQFMACGSTREHRLDVDVPVSTQSGSIGSTVAFVATLRK